MTGSATVALLIIYGGKIVLYRYSPVRALLGAKTATNTTVLANLANLRALVVAGTLNYNTLGIVYKMYYSIRTFLYT